MGSGVDGPGAVDGRGSSVYVNAGDVDAGTAAVVASWASLITGASAAEYEADCSVSGADGGGAAISCAEGYAGPWSSLTAVEVATDSWGSLSRAGGSAADGDVLAAG